MSHTLVLNSDASPIGILPLSVMPWQDAIKSIYVGSVVSVHDYDDWTIHSPTCRMKVPSVVMTKSFVNFRKTVAFTKENVYLRDDYRCQYCGKRFHPSDLTYDHVVPRSKGGRTNFTNITTACFSCNHRRGDDESIRPKTMPVRPTYYHLVDVRRKYLIHIADPSWTPYIGWRDDLVKVSPPRLEPGMKKRETERLIRTIDHGKSF